jgi:hypothetical protein
MRKNGAGKQLYLGSNPRSRQIRRSIGATNDRQAEAMQSAVAAQHFQANLKHFCGVPD